MVGAGNRVPYGDVVGNRVPYGDGGREQLISNSGRFKQVFAKRNKKQTMIDLRGTTNWL